MIVTIALLLIGAFYIFAGAFALRAGAIVRLIDQSTAEMAAKPVPRVDILRARWLLAISGLTFVSGLMLIARLNVTVLAFLACAGAQALYLFHVAPTMLDPLDAPDARGRQQSINAFVIYVAATLFVAWAWLMGRLVPLTETGWPVLALVFAVGAVYCAYAFSMGRPQRGDG